MTNSLIYLAAAGARQQQRIQATQMNNLANVSTTGFRSDLVNAQSVFLQGSGYDTNVYPTAGDTLTDFTPGGIRTTGNPLDIAINGQGLMAIQTPAGQEAYTRAGSLQLSATGTLMTASGDPVLSDGGAPVILPPAKKIEIGSDGTIRIQSPDQTDGQLSAVARIKLVDPDIADITKGTDGFIHLKNGGLAELSETVTITSGAVEESNVNPVSSMVDILETSRAFEMQVKLLEEAKSQDQAATGIVQF